MWIMNQNHYQITNINTFDRIAMKKDTDGIILAAVRETGTSKGNARVQVDLGKYVSKERAQQVLKEIYEHIADGTTFYSMPTE